MAKRPTKRQLDRAAVELHNMGVNARILSPAAKLQEQIREQSYILKWLIEAAERAARNLRSYTAEELRQWAARAQDCENNGIKTECLMALDLEGAANSARTFFKLEEGEIKTYEHKL